MGRSRARAMQCARLDSDRAARFADRRDGPSGRVSRLRRCGRRPLPTRLPPRLPADPRRKHRAANRQFRFIHRGKYHNMKIASFKAAGRASYGPVTNGGVIDAGKRLPDYPTLKQLLARGPLDMLRKLASEAADHALADVELLPTLPDPDKIFCIGVN